MKDNETIIIVGVTEPDEYGNLWVTPQGGGDKVKIAKKREKLHPIFQQGKAVLLHWETYMNKPYVSDAKPVEGELSAPVEISPEELDEITREDIKKAYKEATNKTGYKADPAKTGSIERQVALKSATELAVADKITVKEIASYAKNFYKFLSGESN